MAEQQQHRPPQFTQDKLMACDYDTNQIIASASSIHSTANNKTLSMTASHVDHTNNNMVTGQRPKNLYYGVGALTGVKIEDIPAVKKKYLEESGIAYHVSTPSNDSMPPRGNDNNVTGSATDTMQQTPEALGMVENHNKNSAEKNSSSERTKLNFILQ